MDLLKYLETSFTAFHAVENAVDMLVAEGFTELKEDEPFSIANGGKYFVVKNGSSLLAFRVGDVKKGFRLAESHTDSPALKVKGNTLVDSPEGKRINVEKYGGMLLYSFLDIPLRIAGRLLCSDDNGKIEQRLVCSDFTVNVPSLAVHHNPEANDKLSLNVQTDMLPLVVSGDSVYALLAPETCVLDADLFVIPDIPPRLVGSKKELLCSPRIDNLTSAFSSINALLSCQPQGIAVACLFDNEEVGSGTKQGAGSRFLRSVLLRIAEALGLTSEEKEIALARSFALSIDNGHAVHPAHPEKSDVAERVYLNKGIVIKHHVNYATDGASSAYVKNLLSLNGIPYQDYYNRSDLRCGGTLGLLTSADLGIPVCDIGLAQLAMHSAVETVGYEDVDRMSDAVTAFFNA